MLKIGLEKYKNMRRYHQPSLFFPQYVIKISLHITSIILILIPIGIIPAKKKILSQANKTR